MGNFEEKCSCFSLRVSSISFFNACIFLPEFRNLQKCKTVQSFDSVHMSSPARPKVTPIMTNLKKKENEEFFLPWNSLDVASFLRCAIDFAF